MSYTIFTSKKFEKSYKRCIRRGLDMSKLGKAISILHENGSLPPIYHAHKLSGIFDGCWECHIQPDWLLVWKQNDTELTLLLLDTGSHSDLFG
ncbi:MAG: type II toxin-antitoxin system YafQ family toxin [Muribaculum sp.]|nr:type II toxin-antitoxin system YafQ family toxin [Muribaculum sp.]